MGEQLQRVGGRLVRREVKTETSEARLPLPDLCVTVLKRLARMTVAAVCCCRRTESGQLQDRNWPLSWVGDTGIEPVTSSV